MVPFIFSYQNITFRYYFNAFDIVITEINETRFAHGWFGPTKYSVCVKYEKIHLYLLFTKNTIFLWNELVIIIIIISILEPCFPLPRVFSFWQVFLEGVLSTQNDFEGQQNPYLASFCHSQALHPMICLACQIFSVQPHSACVLLQSSLCCALHVQTISSYWCGAPHLSPGCQALWEGSLSYLHPLPWHCRSNGSWHGHYARDGSVYPPSWPKSPHSSHMMSTPYLWSEGADGGWWEGEAIGGTCPMHICSVWSQSARSHLLQRSCPQGSRTLGQLQAFRFQSQPLKLFFHR